MALIWSWKPPYRTTRSKLNLFIVTVDPEQDNNPWGAMATPKGSVMTGSDSYQKFTVLDEEIEVYLRITKVDEETGKPVLLPDTAFQIYWLDEQGHYRYDSNATRNSSR